MRRSVWGQVGPVIGLGLLCVLLTILSPHFLRVENLLNIFRQSAVNACLALGQLLVILTAGIDLSVGSALALAGVSMALMLKAGLPTLLVLPLTLAVGLLLGLVNGLLLTRLRLPHPFIATLGTMNVARGAAFILTGGFPVADLPEGSRFLGAGMLGPIPVPVVVVLVTYGIVHVFLTRTTVGREIYAVGGNAEAARLSGVPVSSRLNLVYLVSGGMAALGAIILTGRMNSGFPLAGQGAELDAIAAVIIGGASFFGGVGNVLGTLVGALVMGILRNGLNLLDVSTFWQTVIIGIVIVGAVWLDVIRNQRRERADTP